MEFIPYNRKAAVAYAHIWAYDRNPRFYNYEGLGGDCTNFASQCLYTGTGVMNFTPTFGWYYRNPNDKSPSWTGVEYFYNFLTEKSVRIGPFALETDIYSVLPGDFIQLELTGDDTLTIHRSWWRGERCPHWRISSLPRTAMTQITDH